MKYPEQSERLCTAAKDSAVKRWGDSVNVKDLHRRLEEWLDREPGRRERFGGGWAYTTVRNYVQGERLAPDTFLELVAQALPCRLAYLREGDGRPTVVNEDVARSVRLRWTTRSDDLDSESGEAMRVFNELLPAVMNTFHDLSFEAKAAIVYYAWDLWRRGEVALEDLDARSFVEGRFGSALGLSSSRDTATAAVFATLATEYLRLVGKA